MLTLLTTMALAAPCLDANLDEILDGPTYTTSDDGTLSITIPTDDYWVSFRCGSVSLRYLDTGPPAFSATWIRGAPWAGVYVAAKDDAAGLVPSVVAFLSTADKGVGVIELADGRAYRALLPGGATHDHDPH